MEKVNNYKWLEFIPSGWICPYCDDCGDEDEKFYKRFNYGN